MLPVLALFRMPYNLLTSLIPKSQSHCCDLKQVLTVLFFSCTTCIVYQYFKELVAFVLKAGAKVRGFILTTKCFRKFFFVFLFILFSGSLCERERMNRKDLQNLFFANRTAKIRTFSYIFQTFSEVFCSYFLSEISLFQYVISSRLSSLGKRVQK